MLIDITQRQNTVIASYATKSGDVELKKFDVQAINGYGIYDYEICDESDPDKEPALRHFKDNLPIRKKQSWQFDFDELREFLLTQIPAEDKEELFAYQLPNMYMVDIEIDIEEGDIFPDPNLALFPIDSIQITSPELNTIVLTTNKRAKQDKAQMMHIEDMINDHYADSEYFQSLDIRLKYGHIVFDTEVEMLEYWWGLVNKKLHSVSFWNGDRFDVPYLNLRCAKLNISLGLGSPTDEVSKMHNWPKHRYCFDYMQLVAKWAYDIFPLVSVSLDHVTNKIFGVGKVKYEGSYKDLYNGPIDRFLLYGAVDTINMQLIHKRKNYTAAKESLVFYTKTTMYDANRVTALVHALCWDELYADNKINAEPYVRQIKEPYGGGYVKTPARKFVMYPVCIDFSALYPRIMQSFNMSFENFMGTVQNQAHKDQLVKDGYYVSALGNYYKNDTDYTLRKIENKMLDERYAYKELMQDIYLKALTPLEIELTKRGLKIPGKA